MKILGIDPGLATTGIGIIDHKHDGSLHVIDWCVITTPKALPLSVRLNELSKDLASIIAEHKPEIVVLEKLFFASNRKTAIDVAQARGVIMETIAAARISILEPTPLQVKSSVTGDGSADKRQVQDMVMRTLNMSERPTPVDAADALALALYGAFSKTLSV